MMICPYCDDDSAVMRSPVRTEFTDGMVIIVREVFCPGCRRTSYAVRSVRDSEDDYETIRRDELKARTGITIRRAFLSKGGCRRGSRG